jgi:hypothetical protein
MRELAIFSLIAYIHIFAILRHYVEGGAKKVFDVHVRSATRAFSQVGELRSASG